MIEPHEFWQTVDPAGLEITKQDAQVPHAHEASWRAALLDGRSLVLPIRTLPGDEATAVASLIINQASFEVVAALADAMTTLVRDWEPDVCVGVPTLGLTLAPEVARRLGHQRIVPLGTSRKFWYDDKLSEPLSSITTPGAGKSIYIDPRMLPLLKSRRIVVVDDVISTGRSMAAVLKLLARINCRPVGIVVAMVQSDRWRATLAAVDPIWPMQVRGALHTPLLKRTPGLLQSLPPAFEP